MIRIVHLVRGLSLTVIVALPACGGAGDDGSSSVASGVPRDEPLVSLSSADKSRVCDAVTAYIESYPRGPECKIAGFDGAHFGGVPEGTEVPTHTDADVQKACADAEAACKAAPSPHLQPPALCAVPSALGSDCTATVGEFEVCVSDAGARLRNLQSTRANSIPACSSLTLADLSQPRNDPEVPIPASCTTLLQKCSDAWELPD